MTGEKSEGNFFSRLINMFQGLGKPKDETVLRTKKSGKEDTIPPVSSEMEAAKLSRVSNNRLTPLDERPAPDKENWQKIKETAKSLEGGEVSDHWVPKQNTILTKSTFDAASTDLSQGQKHKRPTMITQARITNNRLQALQASMEKPKSDIDKRDDGDPNLPGH